MTISTGVIVATKDLLNTMKCENIPTSVVLSSIKQVSGSAKQFCVACYYMILLFFSVCYDCVHLCISLDIKHELFIVIDPLIHLTSVT